ncbi:hypothetical protein IMY05_003G0003100 [Salix suchowensis]|nr:hypothetical protein IMY05_003G0003100 [Salix suchowensis]
MHSYRKARAFDFLKNKPKYRLPTPPRLHFSAANLASHLFHHTTRRRRRASAEDLQNLLPHHQLLLILFKDNDGLQDQRQETTTESVWISYKSAFI